MKRIFIVAGLSVVTAATALYLLGLLFGVGSRWGLFSAALAFPGLGLLALLLMALIAGGVGWALGARGRAVMLGTGLLVAVLTVALVVTAVTTPPTRTAASLPTKADDNAIRVLTWNVRQGDSDAQARAALLKETAPDIVVFTELYAGNLGPEDIPAGYTALGERGIAVTVLVAAHLGAYRVVASDNSGATSGVVVAPVDPNATLPRIVGVHITRMTLTGDTSLRDFGLDWVAHECAGPSTVALGDFNASPVNMPRGQLGDCAAVAAFAPSWPSSWAPLWGAPIDNVLATENWTALTTATLDIEGSETDHRPVIADLTLGKSSRHDESSAIRSSSQRARATRADRRRTRRISPQ